MVNAGRLAIFRAQALVGSNPTTSTAAPRHLKPNRRENILRSLASLPAADLTAPRQPRSRRLSAVVFVVQSRAQPHGLHVDELLEPVLRQLAPVARALDAPERQPGIGLHESVHEDRAHLELARQPLAPCRIRGPHRGAEPVAGRVGDAHCLRFVFHALPITAATGPNTSSSNAGMPA